jgi:CRP/FNR family transcriptional regulator, cyclic AMP receptor protein
MSDPLSSSDAAAFRDQPFLRDLDPPFLEELLPHTRIREYEGGATVVREGGVADEFFLILAGKIGLEMVTHDRPRLTILTLGPGEVLGWSWILPPYRWRIDARALKPTRVFVVAAEPLRRALQGHPRAGFRFLLRLVPILGQRLDATRLQVLDVHRA